MLTDLQKQLRSYDMLRPGDTVTCAVSGGADSVALLFGMYLLKDKLGITLQAAHFNHHLRGEESNRDEAFVRQFCDRYDIPLTVGQGNVVAGKKGLEAAARDARYAFLKTLSGKIATAHTADDNAETLLMHLIRGTGLKGLGGIAPVRGNIIRPMLTVTRREVLQFLEEEGIPYVTDSSNETDAFLRNRLRHHVMPLLTAENPSLAENLSATALRLRQDEEALDAQAELTTDVAALREMPDALQTRALQKLLLHFGLQEPEGTHVELLRRIVCSDNPSASGRFAAGLVIGREYDHLIKLEEMISIGTWALNCPGKTKIPALGICVIFDEESGVPVCIEGNPVLRSRQEGDTIRLSCGTKRLKKLFIDQKIPAHRRSRIPVIADDAGVVAIPELNLYRVCEDTPNCRIRVETV